MLPFKTLLPDATSSVLDAQESELRICDREDFHDGLREFRVDFPAF